MAQLEEADNTYDSAGEAGKPNSKSSAGGHSTTKKTVDVSDGSNEGSGSEDEEYEIEAIIDSKRGMFRRGEQAFLVKWKGYDSEHNSWVAEEDAGNAQELITEFFKQRVREKAQNSKLSAARGNKAVSAKSSKSTKGASPDTESVSVSTSKRGHEKAMPPSSDEEDSRKTNKKPKAASTNGASSGKRGPLATLDRTDDEDVVMADANGTIEESHPYTTMKDLKLGTLKNWEDYVSSVTTVERHPEGLMIYFETTDGKHVREPSAICAKRFPQKLIKFYEEHLRWKMADGDVSDPGFSC